MKQFFILVFGGLSIVIASIGIAYGGAMLWKYAGPPVKNLSLKSVTGVASALSAGTHDGTSISGIKRTVRFSANEEEDLISAAAQALPHSLAGSITASAFLVRNLNTGISEVENQADRIMPIASLTKLVTAVVAQKLIDPEARISITKDIMSTYGNTASFKVGETFRAGDLMYPLLMVSSNDSAEALARKYGRKKFIQAMNDFTQSIGAYRTYFDDPSGLSPNNVSTANDLSIILDWIRKNAPEIMKITQLKSKTIRSHTWTNPTHFLNWSNYMGGKNGYTPEANRTGAALFSMGDDKKVYSVILLGSEARDADVIKLLGKIVY